ncbi:hypothetical protein Taro_010780, partial [Colocasia esculenta]|nr:hypothetical protein [Colocasia esculenta]
RPITFLKQLTKRLLVLYPPLFRALQTKHSVVPYAESAVASLVATRSSSSSASSPPGLRDTSLSTNPCFPVRTQHTRRPALRLDLSCWILCVFWGGRAGRRTPANPSWGSTSPPLKLVLEVSPWWLLVTLPGSALCSRVVLRDVPELPRGRKVWDSGTKMRSCDLLVALLLCFLTSRWAAAAPATCSGIVPMKGRVEAISITEFGGVGDGRTLNTWAFQKAIYRIQHLRRRGGTLLYVPPGVWLTGSFNLTSHMTLYLAREAVIKATQDTSNWPLIDPLPSYGRGRELPGGRYLSLIHGDGLHDVIITGEYGTIDGQGDVWWNMWRQRSLRFTRPNLVEFMNSRDILISNVIFRNSPFWNIHPVYCSNIVIRYVTILAPSDSPNTDGIDPDSSSNVCIEDSYISTGDDLVAVKSGWDEYGMAFGRPSYGITIRRITGSSPFAGIAVGSETSGGIENVLVESINLSNMGIGIHIKTNVGRGGYIKNITISDINMNTTRKGLRIAGNVGDHPDDNYNPNAIPVVDGITIRNVWGVNVLQPGTIQGIKSSPFTRVCLSNVKLWGASGKEVPWKCTDVSGAALEVQPWPCSELTTTTGFDFCSVAS